MGQYYKALTIQNGTETVWSLYSKDASNGIKLMEHSWCGNFFTDFMSDYIYKKPTTIAWVGDYADETGERGKKLWVRVRESSQDADCEKVEKFNYSGKFLVNHSKKIAFSVDYCAEERNTYPWVIYPVSLLTAVGNGQGGGDYRSGTNLQMVGTWAEDLISIEDAIPEGYEKIKPIVFAED